MPIEIGEKAEFKCFQSAGQQCAREFQVLAAFFTRQDVFRNFLQKPLQLPYAKSLCLVPARYEQNYTYYISTRVAQAADPQPAAEMFGMSFFLSVPFLIGRTNYLVEAAGLLQMNI